MNEAKCRCGDEAVCQYRGVWLCAACLDELCDAEIIRDIEERKRRKTGRINAEEGSY